MNTKRFVVVGTLASSPYAGMAWMHMQIAAGLQRLGHDVYYFEVTSTWPYDPMRQMKVNDSDYAVPYLERVVDGFGLGDRWAFRRSYSDNLWFGMSRTKAEELLEHADAVFNIAGATCLEKEGLHVGRLVYYGTDPVYHEIAFAKGDENVHSMIEEYHDIVTYGENIGNPNCPIPPLPRLRARTRQPVLLDLWGNARPAREEFTTVCNWKQEGHDIEFQGETYHWSKHHEFLKYIDLPLRTNVRIELAMGLGDDDYVGRPGPGDPIPSVGISAEERVLLASNGWNLVNAHSFTTDPWMYRDYIVSSKGEFTVAKDQYARPLSGWFSERSACYLAAGRPVVTQDTGFGAVFPTGEGLFPFQTMDDILAAFDAIKSDYQRHSRAAREIAEEYFRAEKVLAKMLDDLGI
jgi:hypothetical protein